MGFTWPDPLPNSEFAVGKRGLALPLMPIIIFLLVRRKLGINISGILVILNALCKRSCCSSLYIILGLECPPPIIAGWCTPLAMPHHRWPKWFKVEGLYKINYRNLRLLMSCGSPCLSGRDRPHLFLPSVSNIL